MFEDVLCWQREIKEVVLSAIFIVVVELGIQTKGFSSVLACLFINVLNLKSDKDRSNVTRF